MHTIDHVIAEKHGVATTEDNLALACVLCNSRKGSDLASIDEQTGAVEPLFHPLQDRWTDHVPLVAVSHRAPHGEGAHHGSAAARQRTARVEERGLLVDAGLLKHPSTEGEPKTLESVQGLPLCLQCQDPYRHRTAECDETFGLCFSPAQLSGCWLCQRDSSTFHISPREPRFTRVASAATVRFRDGSCWQACHTAGPGAVLSGCRLKDGAGMSVSDGPPRLSNRG